MTDLKLQIACVLAALCLALSSISAAQTQPSGRDDKTDKPSAAAGTITGRVMLEDGRPAAGAMISVYDWSSGRAGENSVADDEGNFSATVAAGKLYHFGVRYPGHFLAQSPTPSGGHRLGDTVTLILRKGGVITGRVTTENGEPVVALSVSAIMVRLEGQTLQEGTRKTVFTDDRGMYRIFGLLSGQYRVAANLGDARDRNAITGFEKDLAVYHPSSSRADAEAVTVEAGREVTGIDIRYRRVRGYSISGTTVAKDESRCGGTIELSEKSSLRALSTTGSRPTTNGCTFSFDGVAEGEYTLLAYSNTGQNNAVASEPRRLSVTATDISGIRLELNPLGSVSGKVVFEAFTEATRPAQCKAPAVALPERTSVRVTQPTIVKEPNPMSRRFRGAGDFATATGDFTLKNLVPGNFAMMVAPMAGRWYVKSILLPQTPRRTINVGRDGLTIGSGEAITGVSIVVVEGSGTIFGELEGDTANARTRWRLFLVPADPAFGDDGFRYHLARIEGPTNFQVSGAPGQYWLVPRLRLPDDISDDHANPTLWTAAERAKLRKEGEAVGTPVEVKACQNSQGYSIVLPQR